MRAAILVVALCSASVAPAQPATKVAEEAAMTPVEDVNLKKKDIPPVLLSAQDDPYSSEGTRNCAQLTTALASLDAVLGPDFDSGIEGKHGPAPTSVAKSVVGSFIPFRGVIREVSGAAGAQRRYDAAVDAGIARRGYLRGIARAKGCKRPPAETAAAN
ncbi:hypothetical protein GON01_15215 [Sphingomonas sp. MAH-20]|jgi:hypothetical protein|uniref:Uncharacterized protein n=1 Tax=Sphingomonas horti TaxID=2682842 RepID=A0A6I4J8Y3_9SPHN|nr:MULTISPECIES: hypothetical protein [Sphingomonas]MBA2919248.1 hypothetical protein [Sphingomonas sp. CGMCC 1.13658]MVO79281.1 hypothetical protein [Sphingomonas horti]